MGTIKPLPPHRIGNLDAFVFDIETIENKEFVNPELGTPKMTPQKRLDFYFAYSATVNNDSMHSFKHLKYHDSRESLQKRLENYIENGSGKYIFAHNAPFDSYYLNWKRLDRKYTVKPISVGFPFIVIIENNSGKKFYFLDTMNFWKNSLESLAEKVGLKKVLMSSEEFENVDNPEIRKKLEERCKQDVLITSRLVKEIFNYAAQIRYFPYTAADLAFKTFRAKFQKFPLIADNDSLEREGYYGGRVEAYRRGENPATILDINSSYPYAMLNYLPFAPVGKSDFTQRVEDVKIGRLAKVEVKIPKTYIPPVPYRTKERLLFPCGRFKTILAEPELSLLERLGYDYRILEKKEYYCSPFLKDYAKTYYEAKQKSNGIEREFYKILLNSLYGKFSQRDYKMQKLITWPKSLKGGNLLELGNSVWLKTSGLGKFSVPVAAFITSYARVYLYSLFERAKEPENIIYCDTDSLFVKPEAEKHYQSLIGEGLGELKREDANKVNIFTSKTYEKFKNEELILVKAKGIRFSNSFEGHRFLEEHRAVFAKISTQREAERLGSQNSHLLVRVVKDLTLLDKKRIWHGVESEPYELDE